MKALNYVPSSENVLCRTFCAAVRFDSLLVTLQPSYDIVVGIMHLLC